MNKVQVATVYAKALLELVGNSPDLEEFEAELFGVKDALFQDPTVRNFVLTPILRREEREDILLKSLKNQASELIVSFVGILNIKDRLEYFPEICKVFSTEVDRVRGRSRLEVQSQESLSEASLEKIRKIMEEKFKIKVIIENAIIPGLIGGFVIRMNDYRIDASIQSKLSTLKKSLLSKKITIGAMYEN